MLIASESSDSSRTRARRTELVRLVSKRLLALSVSKRYKPLFFCLVTQNQPIQLFTIAFDIPQHRFPIRASMRADDVVQRMVVAEQRFRPVRRFSYGGRLPL